MKKGKWRGKKLKDSLSNFSKLLFKKRYWEICFITINLKKKLKDEGNYLKKSTQIRCVIVRFIYLMVKWKKGITLCHFLIRLHKKSFFYSLHHFLSLALYFCFCKRLKTDIYFFCVIKIDSLITFIF